MKLSASLRQTLSDMLRGHVRRKYRTQAEAARAWGVRPTFVARVLSGDRAPTNAMMDDAGIVLVAMFRATPAQQEKNHG